MFKDGRVVRLSRVKSGFSLWKALKVAKVACTVFSRRGGANAELPP